MKKDVFIFIKGIQDIDGEKDTIEMLTRGKYYKKKGSWFIDYDEAEEEDAAPTIKTKLQVDGTEKVTMTRRGKRRSQLIIESGTRHQCLYDNGFTDWIMGVQGGEIRNDLKENGGMLNFRYSLDINTVLSSENEVNIVVKECEHHDA
jgi:uncharacterized beta-barrel protein YwiB (DUF1934 family)